MSGVRYAVGHGQIVADDVAVVGNDTGGYVSEF